MEVWRLACGLKHKCERGNIVYNTASTPVLWKNFYVTFPKLNHFPCSHDNWIYNVVEQRPSYSAETLFSCWSGRWSKCYKGLQSSVMLLDSLVKDKTVTWCIVSPDNLLRLSLQLSEVIQALELWPQSHRCLEMSTTLLPPSQWTNWSTIVQSALMKQAILWSSCGRTNVRSISLFGRRSKIITSYPPDN